jgi:hypothetical protein
MRTIWVEIWQIMNFQDMLSLDKAGKFLSSEETVSLFQFRNSRVEAWRYPSLWKLNCSLLFCCTLLVSFHVLMHRLKEVSKIYSTSSWRTTSCLENCVSRGSVVSGGHFACKSRSFWKKNCIVFPPRFYIPYLGSAMQTKMLWNVHRKSTLLRNSSEPSSICLLFCMSVRSKLVLLVRPRTEILANLTELFRGYPQLI